MDYWPNYLLTYYIFCTKMIKNFLLLSVTISPFFFLIKWWKTQAFHFSLYVKLYAVSSSLITFAFNFVFKSCRPFWGYVCAKDWVEIILVVFRITQQPMCRSGSVYWEFEPRQVTSVAELRVEFEMLVKKQSMKKKWMWRFLFQGHELIANKF